MSLNEFRRRLDLKTLMLLSTVGSLALLSALFITAQSLYDRQVSAPTLIGSETPTAPPPPPFLPIAILGGASVCVLGSMGLLLAYLRNRARAAHDVLSSLRQGQLSARLSPEAFESFGGFTAKFNEMADEIEGLVTRLRRAEKNRIEIIQDIGHDLRHPLSAIRVLTETLESKASVLTTEQTREIRELLKTEILAIEDMLEDLLTLATLENPKLELHPEEIDLSADIGEFLYGFQTLDPSKKFNWEIASTGVAAIRIRTDRRLFFRMLRNAVENARRFARSKVTLRLGSFGIEGTLLIEVIDDGHGFDSHALEWFRRRERHTAVPQMGRGAGLGLGSFVIRKIAALLGAELEVDNLTEDGRIAGGRLRIRF